MFVDHFVAACQADERVVTAVLVGSYAQGTTDVYSDLDLYLLTTDEAYESFFAEREAFLRQLGELVFLEDFGIPKIVFYIFADGTEGELYFGRRSDFDHTLNAPGQILLDKRGALTEMAIVLPEHPLAQVKQIELLRRQLYWFWHELSHFITALGRGQLWWAYGQLEALRRYCVNLLRLQQNIGDTEVGEEAYFKIEKAIPIESLSVLQATICPFERDAMLRAVFSILRFYREHASVLAQQHEIVYPVDLERVMLDRLEKLRGTNDL